MGDIPQNSPGKLGFLDLGAAGIEQAEMQVNGHAHGYQDQYGQAEGQYYFQERESVVFACMFIYCKLTIANFKFQIERLYKLAPICNLQFTICNLQ